ncbi:uncharacterized protein ASCRUDRAFT_80231 [Ascoidea rubescens DSM 1968]|uniref:Rad60/SUMO-like domain-containing protein n=1 Tax=Ascoidea rubescens DSM 1968 TaxID=1344418 RepID=A0A1D2VJQ8_9ASCO|nr:hypothetical protein ASCRUDRAFT_80231 [Ascoidea rubescens DSM 1968]ODV61864.1 hypothetical protein ASCRUDRAFT_80231 [Ascoidea rubescens DSM 1968]
MIQIQNFNDSNFIEFYFKGYRLFLTNDLTLSFLVNNFFFTKLFEIDVIIKNLSFLNSNSYISTFLIRYNQDECDDNQKPKEKANDNQNYTGNHTTITTNINTTTTTTTTTITNNNNNNKENNKTKNDDKSSYSNSKIQFKMPHHSKTKDITIRFKDVYLLNELIHQQKSNNSHQLANLSSNISPGYHNTLSDSFQHTFLLPISEVIDSSSNQETDNSHLYSTIIFKYHLNSFISFSNIMFDFLLRVFPNNSLYYLQNNLSKCVIFRNKNQKILNNLSDKFTILQISPTEIIEAKIEDFSQHYLTGNLVSTFNQKHQIQMDPKDTTTTKEEPPPIQSPKKADSHLTNEKIDIDISEEEYDDDDDDYEDDKINNKRKNRKRLRIVSDDESFENENADHRKLQTFCLVFFKLTTNITVTQIVSTHETIEEFLNTKIQDHINTFLSTEKISTQEGSNLIYKHKDVEIDVSKESTIQKLNINHYDIIDVFEKKSKQVISKEQLNLAHKKINQQLFSQVDSSSSNIEKSDDPESIKKHHPNSTKTKDLNQARSHKQNENSSDISLTKTKLNDTSSKVNNNSNEKQTSKIKNIQSQTPLHPANETVTTAGPNQVLSSNESKEHPTLPSKPAKSLQSNVNKNLNPFSRHSSPHDSHPFTFGLGNKSYEIANLNIISKNKPKSIPPWVPDKEKSSDRLFLNRSNYNQPSTVSATKNPFSADPRKSIFASSQNLFSKSNSPKVLHTPIIANPDKNANINHPIFSNDSKRLSNPNISNKKNTITYLSPSRVSVRLEVNKNAKIGTSLKDFCKKSHLNFQIMKIFFNGAEINQDFTPDELGLDNDDIINLKFFY